jgi:hypothetical protein
VIPPDFTINAPPACVPIVELSIDKPITGAVPAVAVTGNVALTDCTASVNPTVSAIQSSTPPVIFNTWPSLPVPPGKAYVDVFSVVNVPVAALIVPPVINTALAFCVDIVPNPCTEVPVAAMCDTALAERAPSGSVPEVCVAKFTAPAPICVVVMPPALTMI